MPELQWTLRKIILDENRIGSVLHYRTAGGHVSEMVIPGTHLRLSLCDLLHSTGLIIHRASAQLAFIKGAASRCASKELLKGINKK